MTILVLSLLGGVLAVDGTSVGQFMISRPIVAGVLAGALLGDAHTGLLVGGALELFFLPNLPAGGARLPECGPASVVAVSVAVATGGAGGLALGVLAGLMVGQVGGWSMVVLRHLNGRIAPDPTTSGVTAGRVVVAHLGAIGFDFVRGGALTGVGILVGSIVAAAAAGAWPLGFTSTFGLVFLAASVPVGTLVAGFRGWERRGRLLIGGILIGLLGALFL